MNLLKEQIIPFDGLESIKLLSSFDDVKQILHDNNIKFEIEYQSNKGWTPEVALTMIHIDNSRILSFAKNKL